MVWIILFGISIAQGFFLVALISMKATKNSLASRLMSAMIVLMIFTNFGYLVIRTELVHYVPQFFALPFGMIYLFGPLFYFYSRAVADPSFRWKRAYWFHFTPYLAQLIINRTLFTADLNSWNWFINCFLAGNLPIRFNDKIMFAIQYVHMFAYLLFTYKWAAKANRNSGNAQYIISFSSRMKWLYSLSVCFSLFLAIVFALYLFVLFNGYYQPLTNYIYTLASSVIIYFVAANLVLKPEAISPDFSRKYQAYMVFEGKDGEKYINKINMLMNEDKIYSDPSLKLAFLAAQVGLPPHQLSKLINERFGKSFNDFINGYRVEEFIRRLNEEKYSSLTVYGIALDVGFNSKSSFNAAFKKITGKTPSDFKTS